MIEITEKETDNTLLFDTESQQEVISEREVVALKQRGKKTKEIYFLCKDKNISISLKRIENILRQHSLEDDEVELKGSNREFISKTEILRLRHSGMSKEMIEHFYKLQEWDVSIATVENILENVANGPIADNIVNGVMLKNTVLNGYTIEEMASKLGNESLADNMNERLDKFIGVATYFYSGRQGFIPDRELLGLLNLLKQPYLMNKINRTNDKIESYLINNECRGGKVDSIRTFELGNNPFLLAFFMKRLERTNGLQMDYNYDGKVYKRSRDDLREKLNTVIDRLTLVEKNIYKKKLGQKKTDQIK